VLTKLGSTAGNSGREASTLPRRTTSRGGTAPGSRSRADGAYLLGRTQTMAIIPLWRVVSSLVWTIPGQSPEFSAAETGESRRRNHAPQGNLRKAGPWGGPGIVGPRTEVPAVLGFTPVGAKAGTYDFGPVAALLAGWPPPPPQAPARKGPVPRGGRSFQIAYPGPESKSSVQPRQR
jgi:hypothetical protein